MQKNSRDMKAQNKKRIEEKDLFIEALKRYREKGVMIYIDEQEGQPEEFDKLCEIREDGSFYMGDYIGSETGELTEIHFDRVYYR